MQLQSNLVQVMQLLLGLLLPLVLALDTRDNSTSTTSESSSSKPTTKATTHFHGTLDGPVLVGLVHQHITEKSEKLNNGENPQQQHQTTELPAFQRSTHQKDEEQPPAQIKSVELHQIHQLHHQTSKEADKDHKLGQVVQVEETGPHQKLEHQAPVIDFHQKSVEDERRSHVHQNMRHAFEVDDDRRAHLPVQAVHLPVDDEGRAHHPVQHVHLPAHLPIDDEGRAHLPVDPFSLHHPFLHTSVAEFEYSEW